MATFRILARGMGASLAWAALSSAAHARADAHVPFSTENEWSSPQINGMGGIGHLSEDMADQFFSDPSLPAQNRNKFEAQWAGLHVTYSRDLATTVNDFRKVADERGNDNSAAQTIDMLESVRGVFGRTLAGGLNATLFALRFQGLSIIPYVSGRVDAKADVPSWPRANGVADAYVGVGLGYAMVFAKSWDLGLNVRPGVRTYADIAADVSDVGDFSSGTSEDDGSADARAGVGLYVPVDVAVGYNPTKTWRFNLVARDAGGAKAVSRMSGDPTPVYPTRLSLGLANRLWSKGGHALNWASEVQDALNIDGKNALLFRWQWAAQYLYRLSFRKQTSFGLNGGLRSGYPSIGAFLDLYLFKLEGAYFTRETGLYVGQRPSRTLSFRAYTQLAL